MSMIYSQPALRKVKVLINTFLFNFKIYNLDADDMFYFGIFCAPQTYANYKWDLIYDKNNDFDIPHELYASCSTPESRLDFVNTTIIEVLTNKIVKPDWMKFIENESSCGVCFNQPSNFLRIEPKKEEYRTIAKALIDFLYSPNRTKIVY